MHTSDSIVRHGEIKLFLSNALVKVQQLQEVNQSQWRNNRIANGRNALGLPDLTGSEVFRGVYAMRFVN